MVRERGAEHKAAGRDLTAFNAIHGFHWHQFTGRVSAEFGDVTVAIGIWERPQTSRIPSAV